MAASKIVEMRTSRCVAIAIFFVLSMNAVTSARSGGTTPIAHSRVVTVFDPIIREAHRHTKLPLRLPLGCWAALRKSAGTKLLCDLSVAASKNRYDVRMGEAGCPGATSCHFATFSGERVGKNTETPEGKFVLLTPHQRGWVYDGSRCADGCDTLVAWRQAGVQYTIAVKLGEVAFVKRLALDSMSQQPR